MLFDVTVIDEGDWVVLAVTGELDLAAAPSVRSRVVQAVSRGATRLVVDLAGVDLLDSSGLGVLVGARRRVRQADPEHGEVRLVVAEARVARVLELSGLDRVFPVFDTRGRALAAGVDPTRTGDVRDPAEGSAARG